MTVKIDIEPIATDLAWAPMRVAIQQLAAPDAGLLRKARAAASDPSVFDEHPPYFLTATISTGMMDAYGTVMRASSLRNYANDAKEGVAVLNSHNTLQLPIGRSVHGEYVSNRGGAGPAHTVADAYILTDWSNGVVNSADIINGIRGGVLRDVSIGFHGGEIVCSICNLPMFGPRATVCQHFPGVAYSLADGDEPVTAIGLVEDARLSEFSIVYDGACPGAMIEKANRMIEDGSLSRKQAEALDERYRMRLPLTRVYVAPPMTNALPDDPPIATLESPATEDPPPDEETMEVATGELVDAVRDALSRAGAPDDATVEWLSQEVLRLRPLADAVAL